MDSYICPRGNATMFIHFFARILANCINSLTFHRRVNKLFVHVKQFSPRLSLFLYSRLGIEPLTYPGKTNTLITTDTNLQERVRSRPLSAIWVLGSTRRNGLGESSQVKSSAAMRVTSWPRSCSGWAQVAATPSTTPPLRFTHSGNHLGKDNNTLGGQQLARGKFFQEAEILFKF